MKSRLLLTGLAAVVLSACGGDGGNSAPTVTTKVSGTAATGAAMANVTVQAKCASGSGSATTAADGTFSINIPNAKRPCVLSATAQDGTVLHSVVEAGSDATAVANITPLTELITAALAQGSTDAFFSQFDANAQARLTSGNLTSSTDTVRLLLNGVVDLTNVDPLKAPLVAANGGKAGNALDQLLDQLAAHLATSKTTVAELATAVGSNAGVAVIQTILQQASDTCAGLRTGNYLIAGQGGLGWARVDAATSTLTQMDEQGKALGQAALVPVTGQACRFSMSANSLVSDITVSKSGVALFRNVSNPLNKHLLPALMVPAQQLSLSELAGNWNALGYERDGTGLPFLPSRITFTLGADGKVTAGADCTGVNSCTAWPANALPVLSSGPAGAYTLTDSSGVAAVAVFKGTDGQLTAVISHADGLLIATKQVVRPLPVVGTKNSFWDLTVFSDLSVLLDAASTEITSVDAAAGTYTRKRESDGRVDTWKQNSPANGLRYRAATASSTAREGIAMTLGNTGVSVLISLDPASRFYDISVNRP